LTETARDAQHPCGIQEAFLTLTLDGRSELLGACPLFGGVAPDDLRAIGDRALEVDFPADHVIARQGEIGTGFFVVIEGRVRVVRDGEEVAELGPGDFFGEMSVIDGLPRVAQVVTTEPTRCLALASWEFERLVLDHPAIGLAILRGLSARLRSKTEMPRH
jgi:CRP/FNR family transcriptional regulator, cyclic AMP receptor protein